MRSRAGTIWNRTRADRPALPRHCSIGLRVTPIDADVARTRHAAVGQFRCPVSYPSFRDTGAIPECAVVFPRSSVYIRHEGAAPFLADPTVVTIYNRAQRYERQPVSPDGDRSDWFAVSDEAAREIASTFDRAAGDSDRPFQVAWAPSSTHLYLRQRTLLARARAGQVGELELEEEVMAIVAEVLARAYGTTPRSPARRLSAAVRHQRLAESARVEILRTYTSNRSVHDLAATLGVSPFHLCRVFRACTGRTMHAYRADLRIRAALEALEGDGAASLSSLAHDLGFASHSHLVAAMRRHVGEPPAAVRARLSGSIIDA